VGAAGPVGVALPVGLGLLGAGIAATQEHMGIPLQSQRGSAAGMWCCGMRAVPSQRSAGHGTAPLCGISAPKAPPFSKFFGFFFNIFLYFYFPFLTLFLNPSLALLVKLLNHSIYLVRALLRAHFYLGENQTCSWAHNEIV